MEVRVGTEDTPLHLYFPTPKASPTGFHLPRVAWKRLNRLRTGVGCYKSSLYKWGLVASAACECGAEEQTADHVIHSCVIYKPPNGVTGLKNLDEATKQWLLCGCPDV